MQSLLMGIIRFDCRCDLWIDLHFCWRGFFGVGSARRRSEPRGVPSIAMGIVLMIAIPILYTDPRIHRRHDLGTCLQRCSRDRWWY